jgi:uncharacterized protein YecE (DUF72 family)
VLSAQPLFVRIPGCVHHYEKWRRHDEAWERYDYSYGDEELMEWVPKIQQLGEEAPLTLVYYEQPPAGAGGGHSATVENADRGSLNLNVRDKRRR